MDGAGAVRACAASDTPVRPVDTEAINVQAIWEQPAPPPSAAAGMHRFALTGASGRGAGAAVAKDACGSSVAPTRAEGGNRGTPPLPPGEYTLRLTVDGRAYTQPVTLKPDPRDTH